MKIDFAREISLKILYKIDTENGYSNIVLDEYLNKYREKLNKKDINLISEIIYGSITWKLTIDYIIQKYSKIKLKKISKRVLNILRLGAYQILFLDKIPKSAAVNECVNLTKKYAFKSTSFVNAILRKIEKKDYKELENITSQVEKISKLYSMPEWLVEELLKEYSVQSVEEICEYSNEKPKTTIRINTLKIDKENFLKKLELEGIEYEETELPNFLYLKNLKNIGELDLFKKGYFTVQDIGAGKIGLFLNPKIGEKVLDACSAPGGKTTHLAELMKNTGEIIACELHSHRAKLVEENAKRLGITIIKSQVKDMQKIEKDYIEKFDKILLDVPCMGFGVMKRKPDIKWQRKKEDLETITKIQFEILNICSRYLKIGGELVYSTCSILKNENEDIIEKWLKEVDAEDSLKNRKYEIESKQKILPDKNTDGFFMCKIKRIK